MALDKQDLQDIRGVVGEVIEEKVGGIIEEKVPGIVERVVEPFFNAIQQDFQNVYERLDRIDRRLDHIEQFLLEDHRRRITKLEDQIKELYDALAIKPKLA